MKKLVDIVIMLLLAIVCLMVGVPLCPVLVSLIVLCLAAEGWSDPQFVTIKNQIQKNE